jgi:peptidoglycan L-alanyl-D-glutamate endopeptidase CwlK
MTERSVKMIAQLSEPARIPFTKMMKTLDSKLGEDGYIIYEGMRSHAVQRAYYAQGRESLEDVNALRKAAGLYLLTSMKQNYKITNTMKSQHLLGRAMDVLPMLPNGNTTWDYAHYRKQFEIIHEAGKSAGLECGWDWKDFPDKPHYQLKA